MTNHTITALSALLLIAGTTIAQPGSTTTASPAAPAASAPASDAGLWVVTADNLLLRSGDAYSFYPVAALKAGTTLQVDAERGGYLRVHYPAGLKVLVKAEEATADGAKVKLSRPSALNALNMTAGPRASWNPLLEKPLPPGTELTLIEPVKDDAGKVTGYLVQPPASARGFVDRQGMRKASPAEADAFAKASAPAPVVAPVTTPAPTTTAANPAPSTTATPTISMGTAPAPATTPATTTPATTTTPAGTAPATASTTFTPPTIPSTTPVAPATAATTTTPPATATTTTPAAEGSPAVTTTAAPAPAPVVVEPPKPSREEELMTLFTRVRSTPLAQLTLGDLNEAIMVFEGYKASIGSDSRSVGRLSRVTGYLQTLTLMRDVKQAREDAASASAAWQQRRADLTRELAALESQRVYQVIGLLVPSVIYDGQNLPKLYRLQSPEPGTFRTVGYITPSPELMLDAKLGNVVGIIGETHWDETLKAPMVTAQRVDVVSLSAIQGSPRSAAEILSTPPAPATSAPSPAPVPPPGTVQVRDH